MSRVEIPTWSRMTKKSKAYIFKTTTNASHLSLSLSDNLTNTWCGVVCSAESHGFGFVLMG